MSRYKGGTLIAEEVGEPSEHERRLHNPEMYRPEECPRCGHDRLHVHDRPERKPRGDPSLPTPVRVLVFRCASEACGATWRILPRFLARHLWYTWWGVERAIKPSPELQAPSAPVPSERTKQRWLGRLASAGRMLVVVLSAAGGIFAEMAASVGLGCTREQVLDAFVARVQPAAGARLSGCSAVLHRLERGVRLM